MDKRLISFLLLPSLKRMSTVMNVLDTIARIR